MGATKKIAFAKCAADEQRAHGRVCIGCDCGDGCVGFSDLQTEELPLLQTQVVAHLVQQNHAFILLLKDGNKRQKMPAKTVSDAPRLLICKSKYACVTHIAGQNNANRRMFFFCFLVNAS